MIHLHVKLTVDEANALIALLDAGVKATGLAMVDQAAAIFGKIKAAPQVSGEDIMQPPPA